MSRPPELSHPVPFFLVVRRSIAGWWYPGVASYERFWQKAIAVSAGVGLLVGLARWCVYGQVAQVEAIYVATMTALIATVACVVALVFVRLARKRARLSFDGIGELTFVEGNKRTSVPLDECEVRLQPAVLLPPCVPGGVSDGGRRSASILYVNHAGGRFVLACAFDKALVAAFAVVLPREIRDRVRERSWVLEVSGWRFHSYDAGRALEKAIEASRWTDVRGR